MKASELREKLVEKGLKVTPQRVAILNAILILNNHPTADEIIAHVRKDHPNIAIGTVYQVLDVFVENKFVNRVKTDRDVMRYDGVTNHHHHLYCSECDLIEDYVDEELNELLKDFFNKRELKGFKLEDIVLQIRGTFDKC